MIRSEVLKSTGERPGRVNVNGRDVDVSGQMVTSLWAKNGAQPLSIILRLEVLTAIIKRLGSYSR